MRYAAASTALDSRVARKVENVGVYGSGSISTGLHGPVRARRRGFLLDAAASFMLLPAISFMLPPSCCLRQASRQACSSESPHPACFMLLPPAVACHLSAIVNESMLDKIACAFVACNVFLVAL